MNTEQLQIGDAQQMESVTSLMVTPNINNQVWLVFNNPCQDIQHGKFDMSSPCLTPLQKLCRIENVTAMPFLNKQNSKNSNNNLRRLMDYQQSMNQDLTPMVHTQN